MNGTSIDAGRKNHRQALTLGNAASHVVPDSPHPASYGLSPRCIAVGSSVLSDEIRRFLVMAAVNAEHFHHPNPVRGNEPLWDLGYSKLRQEFVKTQDGPQLVVVAELHRIGFCSRSSCAKSLREVSRMAMTGKCQSYDIVRANQSDVTNHQS